MSDPDSNTTTTGDRLTVVDELFLHRHRGRGLPSVMQGLWRTDDTIGAPLLISLHDALSRGPLGRRVVLPGTPGARPRFEPTVACYPLRYGTDPIPVDDLLTWADEQADIDVDPSRHPGWALVAAPLDDGGTVVSLVCSHVLSDARGLITAVADALAGRIDTPVARSRRARAADLRDAAQLVRRVTAGLRHVRFARTPKAPVPAPLPVRARPRTAIVDVDAAAWDGATDGGTANSLFLAVTAGIALRAGIPDPVDISVPVDARDGTTVANGVTMAAVTATADDTPASLRVKASAAYRQPRESAPHGIPEEILQLMPDRLAARLARGAGERDLLCSNIGRTPELLDTFGPHRCVGLALRAVHPGLGTVRARTATRLSAYLCRHRDVYTIAFVALDEHAFPDRATLRAHIDTELAARALPAHHW